MIYRRRDKGVRPTVYRFIIILLLLFCQGWRLFHLHIDLKTGFRATFRHLLHLAFSAFLKANEIRSFAITGES